MSEIARAIAGLAVIRDSTARVELREHARNAITALERLARENERLAAFETEEIPAEDEVARLNLRIAELEAERDRLKAVDGELRQRIEDMRECARDTAIERDAIQAKTIDECAAMAQSRGAPGIAEAVRALKPSEEKP